MAATKHAAWYMVMGGWSWWATAARLGARFGPASPGPRVAPTCFAPFRVSTLFQAEATPQPRSERASSTRRVRARCAHDPWHVRGVWAWVGLTQSLLAGARPVDRVLPARCRAAGTRDPTGPGRPEHERVGPGRTQGAASVPPCEARTAREVDSATAAGSVPPGTHTSPAPGSRSPRPQLAVSHARAPYGKISRAAASAVLRGARRHGRPGGARSRRP